MSLLANPNSTAGRILATRNRLPSLFDGSAPAEAPSIFKPGAAPSFGSLQAAAAVEQATPQQGPGNPDPLQEMRLAAIKQSQMSIVRSVQRVTGGDIPNAAIPYIQRSAEEGVDSGPGKKGGGFIGRIFAGDAVPGLTDEQNKKLRQQSLLMAGLTMLANGGSVTLGQSFAMGVLAARASATETAGRLLDEQQAMQRTQKRYATLTDSNLSELERWNEIRRRAVSEGDLEAVSQVIDIIKELRESEAGANERKVQIVDGNAIAFDNQGNAFDPFTGARLANAPQNPVTISVDGREFADTPEGQEEALRWRQSMSTAGRDPNAGRSAEGGEKPTDTLAIASRFDSNPIVKQSADIAQAVARVNTSAKNPSAAGDLSLIFAYMRALDPGSAVREGEFANAQNAAGVPGRIRSAYNNAIRGERLNPEQRADFVSRANALGREQRRQLAPIIERFSEMAREFGINPAHVVYDPFAVGASQDEDDDFGFGALVPKGGN